MKKRRILSLLTAMAVIAGTGHGFMPKKALAAPEAELTASNKIYRTVESESSEYGVTETYIADENGNRVETEYPKRVSLMSETVLPSSYRNEDAGFVRNQRSEGTCASFGSIGAIEANLIKKGITDKNTVDFSEAHLHYFAHNPKDEVYMDGVNIGTAAYSTATNDYKVTAVLSKWSGLELEENVPYTTYAGGHKAVDEEKRWNSYTRVKKLVPIDPTDKTAIKNAIMEYGAVTLIYKSDYNYYNENKYYYYSATVPALNHEVLLVGWDDSVSADNFPAGADGTKPTTDGAWIIRNSWGENWGDNGYFYMSYENAINYMNAFDADLAGKYDNNYGYTGDFWQGSSSNPSASANVFTAKKNEVLKAIGVTVVQPADIDIYIFKNLTGSTPDEGTQVLHQQHTMTGIYEEIKLDNEIPLTEGDKFSVIIDGACVYYEWNDGNYSYNEGESYIIPYTSIDYDGTHESSIYDDTCRWTDTATGINEYTTTGWDIGNAYIRAYTDDTDSTSTPKPIPTPKPKKTELLENWNFEDGNTAFTNINTDRATLSVETGTGENTTNILKVAAGTLDTTEAAENAGVARAQLDFSSYIPDNALGVRVEFDASDFTASSRANYLLYDDKVRLTENLTSNGIDAVTGALFRVGRGSSFKVNGETQTAPNAQWSHVTIDADYVKGKISYSITSLDGETKYLSGENMEFRSLSSSEVSGLEIINWKSQTNAYIDNIKLYAKTPQPEYSVTLNTGGGTINSGNIEKYTYSVGAVLPTDVTKDGYYFVGWYDNAELTGNVVPMITDTDTGDKTYWAKWTDIPPTQYEISFVNYDNTPLQTVNVTEGLMPIYTGATPAKPEDAQYTYTFDGWSPEIAPATAAATYTAKFKSVPKEYTVTLNANGGTVSGGNVIQYKYGTGTVLPTDVTKDNYYFAGWYDNEECKGEPVTAISDTDTGDKEYWAKWGEITQIKIMKRDFEDSDTVFENVSNQAISINSNGLGENSTKILEVASSGGNAGSPARAQFDFSSYIPDNALGVRVEFDAADFTSICDTRVNYLVYDNAVRDEKFDADPTMNTDDGTIFFMGQRTSNKTDADTGEFVSNFLVNGDRQIAPDSVWTHVTVEADYASGLCKYSVTSLDGSETFLSGESAYCDTDCTKISGIEIVNWLRGTAYLDNIELYAQVPVYNVTLNTNGGTINGESITMYIHGTETALPTDVTKSNYYFAGWYDNEEFTGNRVLVISAADEGDKEYWAKWTDVPPAQYEITFVNYDNTPLQTVNVTEGFLPVYTSETPEKPSDEHYTYTFDGWSPEITAVSGAATYTAKFKSVPREYTVTLNTNGGTVNSGNVTKYTFGTGATLPTDVTKNSCQFEGWYDNDACEGAAVTEITATDTGDKTYYAKWREVVTLQLRPAKVRNELGSKFDLSGIGTDAVHINGYSYLWGVAYFGYSGIANFDPALVEKATLTFTAQSYDAGTDKDRQFTFRILGADNNSWTAEYVNKTEQYPAVTGTAISEMACQTNGDNGDILKPDVPKEFDITSYVKTLSKGTTEMSFIAAVTDGNACVMNLYSNPALTITMTKTDGTEPTEYSITFVNYDNSVLQSGNVEVGETPAYTGETPTKPSDDMYSYTFIGWSPEVTAVSGVATYTAQYTKTPIAYSVKLQDDGSVTASAPEAGTHCVVFAAYKDGVLTCVKIADAVFDTAKEITVAAPDGFNADGADTVKVMLWTSLKEMKPLCSPDNNQ